MSMLTVGEGKQYATVAAAVAATADGDTVLVDAGTYTNDFFTNYHQITLQSVGGMAILKATESPPNGKAIVTTDASITIDGFGFTGASVSDLNGAGIRYEWGDMVVRNCLFWDNQDGILAAALGPGHILIQNSEFSHNGAGDGYSHNIYVNGIESLVIENSYFHDSVVGHEIKSRAHNTTLLNNRIQDNAGDGSYSIDLPNGGNALIQGNVIEKGANAQNYHSIHFGGEGPPYDGSNLTIDGNTLINDHAQGRLVLNHAGSPVTLSNNQIWGYAADNIAVGPVTQQGNTILASRPALDLTTMAPPAPPPPTEPPQFTVPTVAHLQSWGAGGAVVASGHVLRVGAGQAFTTLSQALTASQDGDTIQVAAGTYVNDFGTVNHKVIIEGVGGLARFVQQGVVWAPNGMLVVNTDATLRNLEFTGATNYSGHEGGIYVTGGNVTVDNSYFHHNDIGIRTADNAGATLSIFGTEAAWNGNVNKGTHNVAIGAIQSLTIQGSYIHGAITGHELSTRSFYTDIEGNRIIDGDGVGASFLINLAQGGDATIRDNVLEKGRDAANGILIHVGNEGPTYDNSDVRITGNTLVSDLANQWHPYTYFIVGDDAGSLLAPITATGNTFVGGVPGSAQVVNGAASGNATAANAVLYTNAPWSAAQAPAEFAAAAPAGLNTLTVRLAEAASVLDAQFVVSVDGAAVGGGVVTASQAAGGSQAFSFNGWWSTGAHAVTVSFINPQRDYAGADGLYVQSVSLDGATTTAAAGLDYWSRSYTTTLTGSSPLPDFDPAYYLARTPSSITTAPSPVAGIAANEPQATKVSTSGIVNKVGVSSITASINNAITSPATEPFPSIVIHDALNVAIANPPNIVYETSPSPQLSTTPPTTTKANFLIANATNTFSSVASGEVYNGTFGGLQQQFIAITSDNLAISAAVPNSFIVTGSGNDAIDVSRVSGNNVLDGGTGSNFLVGGAGNDTFFLDNRNTPSAIWSTVVNFHSGDAATIWGLTPHDFALQWFDRQGAADHQGLTLQATAPGRPNASLTLTGYSTADLNNGRLSMVFGASPKGSDTPGASYLYIHAT